LIFVVAIPTLDTITIRPYEVIPMEVNLIKSGIQIPILRQQRQKHILNI